ncbi:MAG: hypothetical protein EOP52_13705 [Sphingobacteriales bacterium]|nr:MAG: hypothetical protein EOP52_13705 [Sphingobacteriales bacterium]
MIELEFHQRPVDVPVELRLYRRLALLTVSMAECCRAGVASFKQLHFLNSLYMDSTFRSLYFEFKHKRFSLRILSPSADPYLNRCVSYALAAGLIETKDIKSGYRVSLTENGKTFVAALKKEKYLTDVFELYYSLGKISEAEIENALQMEKS